MTKDLQISPHINSDRQNSRHHWLHLEGRTNRVGLMFNNFGRRVTRRNSLQTIMNNFLTFFYRQKDVNLYWLKLTLELCRALGRLSSSPTYITEGSNKECRINSICQSRGHSSQRDILSLNSFNKL